MRAIIHLFPDWTSTLGWTLLHSLWQALIIYILVIGALRIAGSNDARIRYLIACAGMLLMLVTSVSTYSYLMDTHPIRLSASQGAREQFIQTSGPVQLFSAADTVSRAYNLINANMPWILLAWSTGAMLFLFRLISGWWYVSRLSSGSTLLENEWSERLQQLASRLGINRIVTLAESVSIQVPVVLGYIKPVILVPIGMFSGLSSDQVETILLHELAHVKRNDYVVNLAQSVIESIFFFNPFAWMLSNIIGREREYCCDDTVIAQHGNSLVYATALATLAEMRLLKTVPALALAENKNQLLNRIKRMMEKSVKTYSGRGKLIPAALLIIGLVCASWLSIHTDQPHSKPLDDETKMVQDTTRNKKKNKSAQYSRKSIITYDKDGTPHEEITENFEGDEELREVMKGFDLNIQIPDVPMIADVPDVPPMPAIPDFPPMHFQLDSMPGFALHYDGNKDWKEFNEMFEKKFKQEFGDFYRSHGKELEKMMEELKTEFESKFDREDWKGLEKEMQQFEHNGQAFEDQMKALEEQMQTQSEQFRAMERDMKFFDEDVKIFEKKIREELVKDGYLDSDEQLDAMSWNDHGDIIINGKKIKDADQKKYQDLYRRYFKRHSYKTE